MSLSRLKRTILGALGIIGLLCAVACEREISPELRLSHPFTENDPRHELATFVARNMSERTSGEVNIRIFPNQQLFKARQQYEGLRTNRIDLAIYPMPWLSGRVPAANLGALPGVVNSARDGLDWRDRRVWDLLSASVEEADVHMASIFWVPATYAARGIVPRTPEAIAGLSMRGMGTPLEILLAAKGAAISSMPAADTYFGLQTGSLDVLFSTVSSFVGYSMQEVVDEIVIGRTFMAGGHFILMSRGARQKLDSEQLEILTEVLKEAEEYYASLAEAEFEEMAASFGASGVRLVELTDDEFDSWVSAAQKYSWKYFRESVHNGAEILEALSERR